MVGKEVYEVFCIERSCSVSTARQLLSWGELIKEEVDLPRGDAIM